MIKNVRVVVVAGSCTLDFLLHTSCGSPCVEIVIQKMTIMFCDLCALPCRCMQLHQASRHCPLMLRARASRRVDSLVVDMATRCRAEYRRFMPTLQLRAPTKAKTPFSICRPQGNQFFFIIFTQQFLFYWPLCRNYSWLRTFWYNWISICTIYTVSQKRVPP